MNIKIPEIMKYQEERKTNKNFFIQCKFLAFLLCPQKKTAYDQTVGKVTSHRYCLELTSRLT